MATFRARNKRMTIYDAMEAQGVFASNPANADSMDEQGHALYKGPVEYPKMFYHPTGLKREVKPGELISTPIGPKVVGQLFELISKSAAGPEEEAELRAEGWHDHPAKAIAASGEAAPPISQAQKEADEKDRRIKELEAQLAAMKGQPRTGPRLPAGQAAE